MPATPEEEFARRRVRLTTSQNFRDLGGYRTASGATVRWGVLYRADTLSRIDHDDTRTLVGLGLKTVIDLRAPSEIVRDGRAQALDDHDVRYYHLPTIDDVMSAAPATADGRRRTPGESYVHMASISGRALAAAVSVLAGADALPAVFHCTAGKDRTGMLAALILSSLGVDDDTIADDYVLTTHAREAREAFLAVHDPAYLEMLRAIPEPNRAVRHEAMHLFLGHLRKQHGSALRYLFEHGLDERAWGQLEARLIEHRPE